MARGGYSGRGRFSQAYSTGRRPIKPTPPMITIQTGRDARHYADVVNAQIRNDYLRIRELDDKMNQALSEKLKLETPNKARKREIRQILENLLSEKSSNDTTDSEQKDEPTVAVNAQVGPLPVGAPSRHVVEKGKPPMETPSSPPPIRVSSCPMPSSESLKAAVCSSDKEIGSAGLRNPSVSSTSPDSSGSDAVVHPTGPNVPMAGEYIFDWGEYEGYSISQVPHHYMSMLRGMPYIFHKHIGLKEAFESYNWSNLQVGRRARRRDPHCRPSYAHPDPLRKPYGKTQSGTTEDYSDHDFKKREFRNRVLENPSLPAQQRCTPSARPALSSQVLAVSCPTLHAEGTPKVHFPTNVPQADVRFTPKPVEIKKEPGTERALKPVSDSRINKRTSRSSTGLSSPMPKGHITAPVKRGRGRPRKTTIEVIDLTKEEPKNSDGPITR